MNPSKKSYVSVGLFLTVLMGGMALVKAVPKQCEKDPFMYLEEVRGEEAMEWVKAQNQRSTPRFEKDPHFDEIKRKNLEIMDDPNKLLGISMRGEYAYNFLQDKNHKKGIYRRASIESYLDLNPNWQTLLDIDQLSQLEDENWVFKGSQVFKDRALIRLSRGGKDAVVVREFDLNSKQFIEPGFMLSEGKHGVSWVDENTLLIGLGVGKDELTESGYPRKTRVWQRHQKLAEAPVVFEGEVQNVSVRGATFREQPDDPAEHLMIEKALDFFHSEKYWKNPETNEYQKLDIPADADVYLKGEYIYFELKSPLEVGEAKYVSGSFLRAEVKSLAKGEKNFDLIFAPTKSQIFESYALVGNKIFVLVMEDVNNRLYELVKEDKGWVKKDIPLPENSSIYFTTYHEKRGLLEFFVTNFLEAPAIYRYEISSQKITRTREEPKRFDPSPYKVEQFFAVSKDGTRVPYYVLGPKDRKDNGSNPTVLSAYGGFQLSIKPFYSGAIRDSWLKHGGVFVLANIRGGGEYGPEWHKAGLKLNRQRVFDDFHAVAEELIKRNITSSEKLGIVGGSNGGLLMGVAITQRPELYKAAAIQVPLLDMLRYHKLLAGASWVGEYGDPEIEEEREFLKSYSPYHNVHKEKKYPEVFYMTSTADDRVHPGHARKMAAKMESLGHPFYYYENTEGGHGGAADNAQKAYWEALEYTYFLQKLVF